MTRAGTWITTACALCVASVAFAEEKTETTAEPQAQVEAAAPEAKAPAETTKAEESKGSAEVAAQPAAAAEETSKPVDAAPAPAAPAEAHKPPAARTAAQGPFQSRWQDASADEKALFLEAFGESSKAVVERWDKATPEQRQKIVRADPLIGARALKHRWASATPEERAAFLEATGRIAQKMKEAWDNATPEQRKMLALEHPYFARKAFHHAWMQATPQEKIAFLAAHAALNAELKARWTGATAAQKAWYAKNYPGLESKNWADFTTEERALFLEANPAIAAKARGAWQNTQPDARAALVRRWQGWPLHAYQARLETPGKALAAAKARPPASAAKPPAKTAKK